MNTGTLSQIQTDALNFIYKNVPALLSWTLTGVKNQIVAGENNCFTFLNTVTKKTQSYCVYSKSWENNYMELTLSDGTIVTSGGISAPAPAPAPAPASTPSGSTSTKSLTVALGSGSSQVSGIGSGISTISITPSIGCSKST